MVNRKSKYNSPRIARLLLKKVLSRQNMLSVLGDFEEIYSDIYSSSGKPKAYVWYWLQVFKSLPAFLLNSFEWGIIMFQNYLKLAFRNLLRNKVFTIINILGLGFALANAIIGYLNYDYARSFDNFHKNADHIFRVIGLQIDDLQTTRIGTIPIPLIASIENNIAGIKNIVSTEWATAAVKYKDNIFNERILYTNDGFFDTFTFPFKSGKIDLNSTNEIVISEDYAQKYFGNRDPIGNPLTVIYNNGYMKDLVVTGIVEKFPKNSSIRFDMVASSQLLINAGLNKSDDWGFVTHALFFNLENPLSAGLIQSQLKQFLPPQITESANPTYNDFQIDPLKDVALNAHHLRNNYLFRPSPENNLFVMLLSGALILLVACFNYINTSLAFAAKRFKEIGVRKTLGSSRFNLISQLMSENILFCTISLVLAIFLTYFIAVPGYNSLSGGETMLEFSPMQNIRLLLFLFALLVFTGILSGLYPTLIISNFNPSGMLKGNQKTKKISFLMRGLLVFQFTISLIAVIGSILFAQNAVYTENFDLGYEKHSIVTIPVGDAQSYDLFENKIKDNPNIVSISGSRHHILTGGSQAKVKNAFVEKDAFIFDVGFNYIQTVKLRLNEGRLFNDRIVTDIEQSVIVSKEFAKQMGRTNPLNELITFDDHTYKIIGTVQDFWIAGTFAPPESAVFRITPEDNFSLMQILIKPTDVQRTNSYLKESWEKLFPYRPYEGYNHNRALAAGLQLSEAIKKWAIAVAFIAIIIAGMGLFSMVSLKIANRTKEIGIRKVLGASVSNILALLNKEFVVMLLISVLIGNVAGYFLMKVLLDSVYVYHVTIGVFAIAIADILILLVSIITVGSHLWKAANINPVESLRYE